MPSIVFIDSRVAAIENLLTGLTQDVRVVMLDATQDGVEQMAAVLNGITGLSAIHIISHGSQGALYLGATTLSTSYLSQYQTQLTGIGNSLTDTGDILFYACNVSSGDAGHQFIQKLAVFTGADIAASTDSTGAASLGGNWVLEAQTGAIDTLQMLGANIYNDYPYVLAIPPVHAALAFRQPLGIGIQTEFKDVNVAGNYYVPIDPAVYDGGNYGAKFSKDNQNTWHLGEDWNAEDGTDHGDPVYAIANGYVTQASDLRDLVPPLKPTLGKYVVIRHDLPPGSEIELDGKLRSEIVSLYAHLDSIDVKPDTWVTIGQKIGTLGNTGTEAEIEEKVENGEPIDSHLHFEIRLGLEYKDPTGYADGRSDPEGWVDPTDFILSHYASIVSDTGTRWISHPVIGPKEPIRGSDGNDTITSGVLDDAVDGRGGNKDVLLLDGTPEDYTFFREVKSAEVAVTGPNGVDIVKNVEVLHFSNGKEIEVSAFPTAKLILYSDLDKLTVPQSAGAEVNIAAETGIFKKFLDLIWFERKSLYKSGEEILHDLNVRQIPSTQAFLGRSDGIEIGKVELYGFQEVQFKGYDSVPITEVKNIATGASTADDYGATNATAHVWTTTSVTTSEVISGTIGTSTDVDRLAVKLTEGHKYAFNGSAWESALDPFLKLYTAGGKLEASNNDVKPGTSNAFLVYTAPATATYYLDISGYNATKGKYLIAQSDIAGESTAASLKPTAITVNPGPQSFWDWEGDSGNNTYEWKGTGPAHLRGHNGNDTITGGNGKGNEDVIWGDDGNDSLRGVGGPDKILGGNGDDYINGGLGDDTLHGEAGNDSIYGDGGNDYIHGFTGRDFVSAGDGDDYVKGGSEDDDISGGDGNDQLYGDEGDDEVNGSSGDDIVKGGTGNDFKLDGGDGDDLIEGEAGNDKLFGSTGNDLLFGGLGNDELSGGPGNNELDGGDGEDWADYSQLNAFSGVAINLFDGKAVTFKDLTGDAAFDALYAADDRYDKLVSIENVRGGSRNDRIDGDHSNNKISANVGNDIVRGHNGADSIDGGGGNDIVWGDEGDDTVTGGSGNDEVRGGLGIDVLAGNTGDDELRGEQGNDSLDGGDGKDVAFFWGERDKFAITLNGDGSYRVADIRPIDQEGIDTVRNVEVFRFFSGDVAIADILSTAPNANNDSIAINEGSIVVVDPLSNDVDAESNTLSLLALNGTFGKATAYIASGKVVFDPNGAFDYLNAGQSATVAIGYSIYDGTGLTDTATITVTINGITTPGSEPSGGGNDTLSGTAGADTLAGGLGDDIYIVNHADDVTLENPNEGTDVVQSLVSRVLGINFENLTLTGSAVNGTGNAGGNLLIGNAANNALMGLEGNDTIFGGVGNDTLVGGAGTDTLDGGTGLDNAVYGDVANAYTITRNGGVTISGPEGIDNLTSIERLQFSDRTVILGHLGRDFGGDGKADLLWRNDAGQPAIWNMDGSTPLGGALVGGPIPTSWKIQDGAGDYNGDGKSDLLWRNDNGQVAIWQMNGSTLVDGSLVSTPVPADWKIQDGAGDYNGDGKCDILWRNDAGLVAIWQMNGATLVEGLVVATAPADWKIQEGSGDYNGDGKCDILWRNDNGQVAIWQMNGGTLVDGSLVSAPVPADWKIQDGAGDYNGDGKSDILWRNDGGLVAIWQMNGATMVSGEVVSSVPTDWKIQDGAGDYNSDGKSDLLWRNDNGQVAIWQMNGSTLVDGSLVSVPVPADWHIQG